jgi:hypothetical protein
MLETITVTMLMFDALCIIIVIADEIRWSISRPRRPR